MSTCPNVERCRSRATPKARGARATRRAPRQSPARRAAEVYGLKSLWRPRSRTAPTTRRAFWCSGRKLFTPERRGPHDAAGLGRRTPMRRARCSRLLEPLARHRISMTRIESRPSHRRKWDYVFFIDIEGHADEPHVAQGARGAEEARVAVPRARLLSARGDLRTGVTNGMQLSVKPGGHVAGELTVPGDKSISHRALMLGGIAEGDTDITGFLAGEDCLATLRALQPGVRIERPQPSSRCIVHGVGIDGLRRPLRRSTWAMPARRSACSWACSRPQRFNSTLIGDESLMRRPMERVAVRCARWARTSTTHDGRPPVEIQRRRGCGPSTTSCRSRARR